MIEAFATPRNRVRSLVLLVACAAFAVGANAVGVSDNPPGILLALVAACAFVLAFVHPWRTSRRFWYLVYASILGFIVTAFLHNAFEALASKVGGSGILHALLVGANVACFLIAILLCPPGLLVGVVGAGIMGIRERRGPASSPPAGT